jgi:hypothetical protein
MRQWLAFSLILVAGCTNQTLHLQLDEELAKEPLVSSSEEIRAKAKDMIESSKLLTSDQKMRLLGLQEQTKTRTAALTQESMKLRSLLLKELAKASFDEEKVDLIKSQLRSVESLRLALLFKAVHEANLIMAHDSHENEPILRAFDFGEIRPELH